MTSVVSIKDIVRCSVKVPEFDKHLIKAGRHIGRNVVEITITIKTIVRQPLMIKSLFFYVSKIMREVCFFCFQYGCVQLNLFL